MSTSTSDAPTQVQPARATLESLQACLVDSSAPIAKRMRSVFLLRHMATNDAIDALSTGLGSQSVLLNHEIAYVLGQLQNPYAVPYLVATLECQTENAIVRHEAAEALGAIGLVSSLAVLERYKDDDVVEVAETCQLSIDRIKFTQAKKKALEEKKKVEEEEKVKFKSVDPAPAVPAKTVSELKAILLNKSASMFERYRAMFALRNKGDEAAVLALAAGFDDTSAVFKHEIAYVMGQMQHVASIPSLTRMLEDTAQHAMVRHEAAEALGAVADEKVEAILKRFQADPNTIVRESCDVALDIFDYWTNPEVDADWVDNSDDSKTETKTSS